MSDNRKFLVETSAVLPAIGQSTPKHLQAFRDQLDGGALYTSVYIRMEFVRRWICDIIRISLRVAQCSTIDHALTLLSQSFSPREVKADLVAIGSWLRRIGAIQNGNTQLAAKQLGELAVSWIDTFDDVFSSRINNVSKCKVGGRPLDVAFDSLLDSLHEFYEGFQEPVTDCEVNSFLQISKDNGRAGKLLQDAAVAAMPVGKQLHKLLEESAFITCKECARIGDVVIAMEQPASLCLVHTDSAFNELCRVRDRPHVQLVSVTGAEKNTGSIDNA
jgi:hypothetical protein